jgi:hypothetical protein
VDTLRASLTELAKTPLDAMPSAPTAMPEKAQLLPLQPELSG